MSSRAGIDLSAKKSNGGREATRPELAVYPASRAAVSGYALHFPHRKHPRRRNTHTHHLSFSPLKSESCQGRTGKRTDFHHRTALLALLPALLRLAPVRRDDGDAVQPVGWTLVACLLGGWHLGRCLGWPPLPSRTVSLPRCRRVTSQGETRSYFGGGSSG